MNLAEIQLQNWSLQPEVRSWAQKTNWKGINVMYKSEVMVLLDLLSVWYSFNS